MDRNKETRHKKLNNKGFTLIELIVSVLIMSIVSLMILNFVTTSLNIYKVTDKQATLQQEATASSLFINELLLEAKEVGSSGPVLIGSRPAECIHIVDPDGRYGIVVLYKDIEKLFYVQVTGREDREGLTGQLDYDKMVMKATGGEDLADDIYSLLADKAYRMDIATDTKGRLITLTMEFRYDDKDTEMYKTTLKVVGRNM